MLLLLPLAKQRNHIHKYTAPATHNTAIPGCRAPDNKINEDGAVVLKGMYAKICGNLDQHTLDFHLRIGNREAKRSGQYMYVNGGFKLCIKSNLDNSIRC